MWMARRGYQRYGAQGGLRLLTVHFRITAELAELAETAWLYMFCVLGG